MIFDGLSLILTHVSLHDATKENSIHLANSLKNEKTKIFLQHCKHIDMIFKTMT